jgi:hypothetical protein
MHVDVSQFVSHLRVGMIHPPAAPFPSFKNRGPRCKRRHQNIQVLGPRSSAREILIGVTVVVSQTDLDLIRGGGEGG